MEGAHEEIDTHALQKATRYDGGYHEKHAYIQAFWRIVHAWSDEQKRKFLLFVTGTDRVPLGGMGQVGLIIQRNGPNTDRLPTAATCYSTTYDLI